MRVLFYVLFFLAFQIEVRVRASGDQLIQEPQFCLEKADVCALSSYKEPFHFSGKGAEWHLERASAVVRHSLSSIELVKGKIWVNKVGDGFSLKTIYGEIVSEDGGGFFVEQTNAKIIVKNLDARMKVNLRGGKVLEVPEGFETWLGPVNSLGFSSTGVVQPVEIKVIAAELGPLFIGGSKKFASQLSYYRDRWGDLEQRSAKLYKEVVLRELASISQKEKEAIESENRKKEAIRQQKELFFQRAFSR